MEKIEIFTVGFCPKPKTQASYGSVLSVGDYIYESAQKIGVRTKTQSEMISVTMAMRCLTKSNYNREIILHIPGIYANQMLDRQDGKWVNKVRANAGIVNETRAAVEKFTNLTINKTDSKSQQIQRCIEIAKKCLET